MAESRMIHKSIFIDSALNGLDFVYFRLFVGLCIYQDDEGLLTGDAEELRSMIFPADYEIKATDVQRMVKNLHENMPNVHLYTDENGCQRIALKKSDKYQTLRRPKASRYSRPSVPKVNVPIAIKREIAIECGLKEPNKRKRETIKCEICESESKILWPTYGHVSLGDMLIKRINKHAEFSRDNVRVICWKCHRGVRFGESDKVEAFGKTTQEPPTEGEGLTDAQFIVWFDKRYCSQFNKESYDWTAKDQAKLKELKNDHSMKQIILTCKNGIAIVGEKDTPLHWLKPPVSFSTLMKHWNDIPATSQNKDDGGVMTVTEYEKGNQS